MSQKKKVETIEICSEEIHRYRIKRVIAQNKEVKNTPRIVCNDSRCPIFLFVIIEIGFSSRFVIKAIGRAKIPNITPTE